MSEPKIPEEVGGRRESGVASILCVDLDGTLLRTDMFHESLLLLLKNSPRYLLALPFWLIKGRARVKCEIARRVIVDPGMLPYHEELLAYLRAQRNLGRRLVLATACARPIAEAIAHHLGIFDVVLASDDNHNLKGSNKAACLCLEFGEKGFSYAGNDSKDLKVWEHASSAIVVGNRKLAYRVQKFIAIEKHFSRLG